MDPECDKNYERSTRRLHSTWQGGQAAERNSACRDWGHSVYAQCQKIRRCQKNLEDRSGSDKAPVQESYTGENQCDVCVQRVSAEVQVALRSLLGHFISQNICVRICKMELLLLTHRFAENEFVQGQCLSQFRLLQQQPQLYTYFKPGWLKQQNFVSFGCYKVPYQGAIQFLGKAHFLCADGCFLAVSSQGTERQLQPLYLLIRALMPSWGAPTS